MRVFRIKNRKEWIEGVSDGLTLPCIICGCKVNFDYGVKDDIWNKVVAKSMRPDVLCLPCLAHMAKQKGVDLGVGIEFIQFTIDGLTVEFVPANAFYYKDEMENQ